MSGGQLKGGCGGVRVSTIKIQCSYYEILKKIIKITLKTKQLEDSHFFPFGYGLD